MATSEVNHNLVEDSTCKVLTLQNAQKHGHSQDFKGLETAFYVFICLVSAVYRLLRYATQQKWNLN